MTRAFISRRVPFYLMGADEVQDSEGFDAYPVEVEPAALANARSLRRFVKEIDAIFDQSAAPEDSAQIDADAVSAGLRRICKTKAQDNRNG